MLASLLMACGEGPTELGPYPGDPFVDADGEEVGPDVAALFACEDEPGAGVLEILWTFGDEDDRAVRRYARDPANVLDTRLLLAPYDGRSSLSSGARFTGFENEEFQVWVGPDADIYVYLVSGPRVEALPRVDGDVLAGC